MKNLNANMTTVQLKRRLSNGGNDLEALRAMLRDAWAIPNGKGEDVAGAIWQAIVAAAAKRVPAGGGGSEVATAYPLGTADADRLALLRTTFTAEAEILAKWGMTPSLPTAGRAVVVEWWRAQLTLVPDAMGRSADTLDRDRAAAAREAVLRLQESAS